MDQKKFCKYCGREIDINDAYCHGCGRETGGAVNAPSGNGTDYTTAALILLVIGTVITAIGAIAVLCSTDILIDIIQKNPEFMKMLNDMGWTLAGIKGIMTWLGIFMVLSTLIGAIDAYLVHTKKSWIASVVLCIIFTFTGFGIILGIITLILLVMSRDVFKS